MKAHLLGHNPRDGATVYEDCETGQLVGAHALKSGQPIQPGVEIATIKPHADGAHYAIEKIALDHSGPAQVATPAYRSGWEATFGTQRGPAN